MVFLRENKQLETGAYNFTKNYDYKKVSQTMIDTAIFNTY